MVSSTSKKKFDVSEVPIRPHVRHISLRVPPWLASGLKEEDDGKLDTNFFQMLNLVCSISSAQMFEIDIEKC
jgi:hypothetical protein